jgi:putative ABC transport system permease protein
LDIWRDKKISLCMIAAVASVVGPLLLLFGIKYGVVSEMRTQLASQPQNLELRMIGSHSLDSEWFDQVRNQGFTGFVVPLTRSLNTIGDLRVSASAFVTDAELIPSLASDPLLKNETAPTGYETAVLSSAAAKKLSVQPGDRFSLIVSRKRDGQIERLFVELTTSSILEPSAFSRPAALLSPRLLVALEDFRDNKSWPAPGPFTDGSTPPDRDTYPRARIYAASMEDVPIMANWLSDQGIETSSRLAEIESIQAIDRLLGSLFSVIAWLGIIGCAASLTGAFTANIDRKRKDLALLRLIGYNRRSLFGYVIVQAMALSLIGFFLGAVFYLFGSQAFNSIIGQALPDVKNMSLITTTHGVIAVLLTLAVAFFVALVGGYMAMKVQPSESLREI